MATITGHPIILTSSMIKTHALELWRGSAYKFVSLLQLETEGKVYKRLFPLSKTTPESYFSFFRHNERYTF
jgi:hypothetical protein